MSCDLERAYGELASRLPENLENTEPFLLDESVIPAVSPEISTDTLFITRGYLQRLPGCRGDNLSVVAPRSVFRQLGLVALALLFHEQSDRVTIRLTNPKSQLKNIVFEYKHWPKAHGSGFRVRPWVLNYVPNEAGTFSTDLVGLSAPLLRLTNISDCQNDERDWQTRDTLWGIGGTLATAEVAEFLLNVGRSAEKRAPFTIPANSTFFAAEVNLWVPEQWEQLRRKLENPDQQGLCR